MTPSYVKMTGFKFSKSWHAIGEYTANAYVDKSLMTQDLNSLKVILEEQYGGPEQPK